jgi:hypothetical protein
MNNPLLSYCLTLLPFVLGAQGRSPLFAPKNAQTSTDCTQRIGGHQAFVKQPWDPSGAPFASQSLP